MAEKAGSRQFLLQQEEEFLKRFSLRKFTVPKERLGRSIFLNQPKNNAINLDRLAQKRFRIEYKELKRALNTNVPWWLRAAGLEIDTNTDRLATLVEEPREEVGSSKRIIPFIKDQPAPAPQLTKTTFPKENSMLVESTQKGIQTTEVFFQVAKNGQHKIDEWDLSDINCIERRLSKVLNVLNTLEYARLDSGCDRCQAKCANNENRAAANANAIVAREDKNKVNPMQNLCICDLEDVDMEIEHLCNCLEKLLECQPTDKCHYRDIMKRLAKIRCSLNEFIKKATSSDLAFVPEKLEKIEYYNRTEKPHTKAEKTRSTSKKRKENKPLDDKKHKGPGCCGFGKKNGASSSVVVKDNACFEPAEIECKASVQKACCVCCQDNVPMYIPCLVLNQPSTGQEACVSDNNDAKVKNKSTGQNEECMTLETSNDRRFCNDLVNCMGICQCNEERKQSVPKPSGNIDYSLDDEKCDPSAHAAVKKVDQKEKCKCTSQKNQSTALNTEDSSVKSTQKMKTVKANREQRDRKSSSNREDCEDTEGNQRHRKSSGNREDCEDTGGNQRNHMSSSNRDDCDDTGGNQRHRKSSSNREDCEDTGGNQRNYKSSSNREDCDDTGGHERNYKSSSNREDCDDTRGHQRHQKVTIQVHSEVNQQDCEPIRIASREQSEVPIKKENTKTVEASYFNKDFRRSQSRPPITTERINDRNNEQCDCCSIQKSAAKIGNKHDSPISTTIPECEETVPVPTTIDECNREKVDVVTNDNCIDINTIQHYNGRQNAYAAAQNRQVVKTQIELGKENMPCRCHEREALKSNQNPSQMTIRICPHYEQKIFKHSKKKIPVPDTDKDMGVLTKDFCYDCFGKDVPIIKKDLAGEIRKIIGNRKRNSVFLKFTVFKCNLYHMQMCTENDYLGCLYATESATFEARNANGFDGCITLTVTDTLNTLSQIECLVDHAFMVVQQEKRRSC